MYENLGKLIVAKGFEKLPKIQKIAQSGHTGCLSHFDLLQLSAKKRDHRFVEKECYTVFDTMKWK